MLTIHKKSHYYMTSTDSYRVIGEKAISTFSKYGTKQGYLLLAILFSIVLDV